MSDDAPADPVMSNPTHYSVLFENERVRVLDYRDSPGEATTPHAHPDSVMVTLTAFTRRLSANDRTVDVQLPAHEARWIAAQSHSGENIGDTPTHTIFVELKDEPRHPLPAQSVDAPPLGPEALSPD